MVDYVPSSKHDPHAVNRLKDRARYDEGTINGILDRGLVAHVTFRLPPNDFASGEEGDDWPVIIPMAYARLGTTVYLHGHLQSRLLTTLSAEPQDGNAAARVKACVAVSHVDGLVLALTPFHNSFNYASAVLLGHTRLVTDAAEKDAALTAITNAPFKSTGGGDRWADSRPPSEVDLKSTRVVAFEIDYASAKVRNGPPKDEKKDLDNKEVVDKYWTGVVKREEKWVEAVPSAYSTAGLPAYVQNMLKN